MAIDPNEDTTAINTAMYAYVFLPDKFCAPDPDLEADAEPPEAVEIATVEGLT